MGMSIDKNRRAGKGRVGPSPALPRLELLAAAVRRWHGAAGPQPTPPDPAVPVAQSVQPDHLVCLETGQHVTLLVGHLHRLGLTLEDYRQRWHLPPDYPTAAPSYVAARAAARSARPGAGADGRETAQPALAAGYPS